jgi:hypothetical protein
MEYIARSTSITLSNSIFSFFNLILKNKGRGLRVEEFLTVFDQDNEGKLSVFIAINGAIVE